ncbi:uncharacterized protein A1O9_12077 [Exophiala aquamarina CBS 119918]|uniref:Zn(2)-C6 fungal-type domain-containing protein n=1 Tax=Exophiala aquamarina CBS 119918 TaxID=1182545 RepID=A0A072P820_9EURO|nr:uncharacterized protein A1O9_12077 [Exophiala aquamarina CBS 119918]KEF51740.1 hypothetical protein A1O9_12077 [Exophiala aquamarina CBS 119918]
MVYRGPSKGCNICRARHIKCDLGRPYCSNCTSTQRTCLGYYHVFEHTHRDKTLKVSKRMQTLALVHQLNPFSAAKDGSGTTAPASMDIIGFLSMPIPPSIPPDIEYSALNFFFLNYSMTPNSQATYGFLDLLPFLYSRSSHSSALVIATTAFAVNIYCLWGLCDRDASTASKLYFKAVMKAKDDIVDPIQTSSDDLLMTTSF